MKVFNKYIATLFTVMIIASNTSYAQQDIYNLDGVNTKMYVANIYIGDEIFLGVSGVKPLLIDSRMYIAATDLSYMDKNVTVGWDAASETVLINSTKGAISYHKGGTSYTLNGEKKELGGNTKFYIVNGKSMIPLSILPTFADLNVRYDAPLNRTYVTKVNTVTDDLFTDGNGNNNENTGDGTSTESVYTSDLATLNVSTINSIESISLFTGVDSKFQTMHLTNPNRFVIDIYGYNPKSFDNGNILDSSFVSNVATYYHRDEDKYRITLNLKSGTTTSNIKATGTTNGINIEYNIPAKTFIYNSDRINSELILQLDSGTLVSEPVFNSNSNTLTLVIPKTAITMNEGEVTYSDRNVEKITTVSDGNNYVTTISLKARVRYTMVSNGSNGTVGIKFVKENSTIPTIVVDAGHGGRDSGSNSVTYNVKEKELNLNASKNIAAMLRAQGYNVIETRNTDVFVDLKDRAALANNMDADLFISVHHNSATPGVRGIETLYYPTADNKVFTDIVQKNLIAATGANNRKIVERPNLVVLNSTKMPAALLELGFISNNDEIQLLMNAEYQSKIFNAVVKSVNEYFGR